MTRGENRGLCRRALPFQRNDLMKKQHYEKPWLPVTSQVELLRSRGMYVSDVELAEQHLNRASYYRLSGYWYPFRLRAKQGEGSNRRLDRFWSGTSFAAVTELYDFDRQLRNLVLEAIERLEVTLRCHISRVMGFFGPQAYAGDSRLFRASFLEKKPRRERGITSDWDLWKKKNEELLARSTQDLARFARDNYYAPHPIWVITETWDLGQSIWALQGLEPQLRDFVAASFGVSDGEVFYACWKTLGPLRNAAAHQCRIWNASFPKIGGLASTPEFQWGAYYRPRVGASQAALGRIGPSLLIMAEFLRATSQDDGWSERLSALLDSFPRTACGDVQFQGLGLPPKWRELLLDLQD